MLNLKLTLEILIKIMRDSDYYRFAKEDIDYVIEHLWTYQEFIKKLKSMEYKVYFKTNKISVKMYSNKRNIKIQRVFEEKYYIKNIQNKICSRYQSIEEVIKSKIIIKNYFAKVV